MSEPKNENGNSIQPVVMLPCPFCGSSDVTLMYDYAKCCKCLTEGPVVKNEAEALDNDQVEEAAIEEWNTRYQTPLEAAAPEMLELLEQFVRNGQPDTIEKSRSLIERVKGNE